MNLLLHLEFFIAVAEEQHFGRAAARLGMTQPPLSQGIKKLEKDLNLTLFHRGPKGVTLTLGGASMLPDAIELVRRAKQFTDTARLNQVRLRIVRLGIMPKVPTALVADLATTVRREAGARRVEISIAPSSELVDQLTSGTIDIGVVEHPALVDPLEGTDVVALPYSVIVPSSHPVNDHGTCDLASLGSLRFASPPRSDGPAAYDLQADAFAKVGFDLDAVHAPDDRWALALVAAGQSFALTADCALSAPGVTRLQPGDASLRLRLRCLRSGSADIADRVLDAIAHQISLYAKESEAVK